MGPFLLARLPPYFFNCPPACYRKGVNHEPPALRQLLQSKFRLSAFREGQLDVIQSVLSGRDALAVMPTGGGKSLCYQLPSQVGQGMVVVISPLIALMKNQVESLHALGLNAGCLHSGQSHEEKVATFAAIKRSDQFLLYLSPERVQKPGFAAWIKAQKIALFAVDESHCVSQWGPDFRKDYFKLSLLRELRPEVPILALTATATPPVLKDIAGKLTLRNPDRHVHGFYRPNLYYQVENCDGDAERFSFLRAALTQFSEGRILIYCGTRNQTEEVAQTLSSQFSGVGFYHAGLSAEQRTQIQEAYQRKEIRVLAATNAFGMGIDHPDVRLVVHFQMPANVESLYQEMGRAGRDGLPSTCLLLYSKRDKGLHSYFITKATLEPQYVKARWRALDTIVQFAEGGECRHAGILTYFRDARRLKACGHCDICDGASARRVVPVDRFEVADSLNRPKKKRAAPSRKAGKGYDESPLNEAEQLRYEVMREWRKRYAEANDMAAFLVFSNKTLHDLVKKNPGTLGELEQVYGMGEHKVEHLGPALLEELAKLD